MWLHRQIALLWVDEKPWSFTLDPSISTVIALPCLISQAYSWVSSGPNGAT